MDCSAGERRRWWIVILEREGNQKVPYTLARSSQHTARDLCFDLCTVFYDCCQLEVMLYAARSFEHECLSARTCQIVIGKYEQQPSAPRALMVILQSHRTQNIILRCYPNVSAILRRYTKSCLLCFFNNPLFEFVIYL